MVVGFVGFGFVLPSWRVVRVSCLLAAVVCGGPNLKSTQGESSCCLRCGCCNNAAVWPMRELFRQSVCKHTYTPQSLRTSCSSTTKLCQLHDRQAETGHGWLQQPQRLINTHAGQSSCAPFQPSASRLHGPLHAFLWQEAHLQPSPQEQLLPQSHFVGEPACMHVEDSTQQSVRRWLGVPSRSWKRCIDSISAATGSQTQLDRVRSCPTGPWPGSRHND